MGLDNGAIDNGPVFGGADIVASPESGVLDSGGVEAITSGDDSAAASLAACSFFPAAMRAVSQDPLTAAVGCPMQPPGQAVHRLSSEAVAIFDPAGEDIPVGANFLTMPDDSPYPINGVVVYGIHISHGRSTAVAMEAVCVLPSSERRICDVVLSYFLATQPKKFI
jgi:hypothetical protein